MVGLVDMVAERKRLNDELVGIENAIIRSDNLLKSDFINKAPRDVIEKEAMKFWGLKAKQKQLRERLRAIPN